MPPLVLLIKFISCFLEFSSKFLFKSVCHQLATFARILFAKYFFHSPWRPKWSQLGVLTTVERLFGLIGITSLRASIIDYIKTCLRKKKNDFHLDHDNVVHTCLFVYFSLSLHWVPHLPHPPLQFHYEPKTMKRKKCTGICRPHCISTQELILELII